MKKIFFILIGMILLLLGCSNDEEYLNKTKKITFPDGVSVEKLVENNIKAGEIYRVANRNFLFNEAVLLMLNFGTKDEINFTLQQSEFLIPENFSEIKWIVEGSNEKGKIIVASNDKIKVRIETEKNGAYIKANKGDIMTYDIAINKIIPQEKLEIITEIYNLAIRNEYKNPKEKK